MTDQHAELDAALERVIDAARATWPLSRPPRAGSTTTTSGRRTSALNNASFAYDEQLLDAFGEVTPWDVESIDPDEADERFGRRRAASTAPTDPHPRVDLRAPAPRLPGAERGRADPGGRGGPPRGHPGGRRARRRSRRVGEAVLELLQAGDGSLGALDIPELEPLDGVVTVSEVGTPVDLEAFDDDDAVGPFQPAADDRLVGRLDEHPFLELDEDHDHAGHQH